MMQTDIIKRIDHLLNIAKTILSNKFTTGSFNSTRVNYDELIGFRAASLSFILSVFGVEHPYYQAFDVAVQTSYSSHVENGISILNSIKYDFENGWLTTVKQLITAEVFSDFLEMSEHLLDENYKDAAAVMIGSVLEEHIRQMCINHKVDITFTKGDDEIPKKANVMNSDLRKAGAYGPLEEKQVIAWLAIRNSAAHGKYNEYSIEQVKIMYQGVLDFLSRVK